MQGNIDFVGHPGERTLRITRDDFVRGDPRNPWPQVFSSFSEQLRAHIGPWHGRLSPRFSTTTALSRAVTDVVLMKTMKAYFKYELITLCYIPELRLLGTPQDWQRLAERAGGLHVLGLGWWLQHLRPVLERLRAVAAGQADEELTRSLYKRNNESGGRRITGWINLLFPYLEEGGVRIRNPSLGSWSVGFGGDGGQAGRFAGSPGPGFESLPAGMSRCPVLWNFLGADIAMNFYGGFVGATWDAQRGAVRPVMGWAVAPGG